MWVFKCVLLFRGEKLKRREPTRNCKSVIVDNAQHKANRLTPVCTLGGWSQLPPPSKLVNTRVHGGVGVGGLKHREPIEIFQSVIVEHSVCGLA